MHLLGRNLQYAVFVASGLIAQRNRNVAGNSSRRIVFRRNIVKWKQANLRTGQFGSFEKH